MSVVNSIETVGPWRKRLEIEIPAPEVDAETSLVVREYGRKVRLPGFRKGKVPASLVQQRFRSEIEHEVVDRLIPRFWKEAQEESELDPILPPSVGSVELQEGKPLIFEATVDLRPEIELSDLSDFDLPEEDSEPSAEEVEEALGRLQSQVADWVDADRPIVRGDRVTLELDELDEDGTPKDGGSEDDAKEVTLEVGDERVWGELTLAVTGLGVGQETDFRRQESIDGEETLRSFHAKVVAVQERDLPPLDDELAKKVGDIETIAALREQIAERLQQEKAQGLATRREQAVLEQLRERHPLELPLGLVQEETQELVHEYAQNLARQGVDLEKAEIDWEALSSEVQPEAERRVHVRLLLDAISEDKAVVIEPNELEERIAVLARAQGKKPAQVRRAMVQGGRLQALEIQLKREKTIAGLLCQDAEEKAGGEPEGPSVNESDEPDPGEPDPDGE